MPTTTLSNMANKSATPISNALQVTTSELQLMCRLCLKTLEEGNGVSVVDIQVPSLPEKIYRVFGIKITDSKVLPNKLCLKCVENVEHCYSHRERYKRLEYVFLDMIRNPATEEAKNSSNSECMFISADSNYRLSLGGSSDPCYPGIGAKSSANNMNNSSASPQYETNTSYFELIQDEIAEVVIAHDSEDTVSGDETICTDNCVRPNDDQNTIYLDGNAAFNSIKTHSNVIYGIKNDNRFENNDGIQSNAQKDGLKVVSNFQFLMASSGSKESSGFKTEVAGDKTNSSKQENMTNYTTKKMCVDSSIEYLWPNLQGSRQTLTLKTKNPDSLTNELYPQVKQVGEWAKTFQSNAPTDPSDPTFKLLFGAKQALELCTKSDGQSTGASSGDTFVQGKSVSPGKTRKIFQTRPIIRPFLINRKVPQQDNNINTSQKISSKRTVSMISIPQQDKNINTTQKISRKRTVRHRMCRYCRTSVTTIWRRINGDTVCNACGLYHKLHGKIRPANMIRDKIYSRFSRKQLDNGMVKITSKIKSKL